MSSPIKMSDITPTIIGAAEKTHTHLAKDITDLNIDGNGGITLCYVTSSTSLNGIKSTSSGYATWTSSGIDGGCTISGNKITVPSGYSYAYITFNFEAGDTNGWPGNPEVYFRKNGSNIYFYDTTHEDSTFYPIAANIVVAISKGDYFQAYGIATHDRTSYEEYGSAINFKSVSIILIP